LESSYQIDGFKLRNQQDSNDNFSAYKVYTKENSEDEWSSAIEIAMPSNGGSVVTGGVQSGNLALTEPLTARYIKLEIPAEYKNRTTGWIRIKEFEVHKWVPITWTGAEDTNWTNEKNWQDDIVPTDWNTATIPAGLDNYPVLTAATTVGSLILEANAELGGQHFLTTAGNNNATVTYDLSANRWYLLSSPMETSAQAFYHNDAPVAGLKKFTPTGNVAGWTLINDLETPIDPGEGFAYRLVDAAKEFTVSGQLFNSDSHTQSVDFGSDLETAFALVGNPFVSTIDFTQLVNDNSAAITDSYLIWTGTEGADEGYTGYNTATKTTWGLINSDLTQYIAPLQSFIVEKKSGANNTVDIVSNATIQASDHSVDLRADETPANLLSITAGNASASVRTFIAQRESGNSSRKLFSTISEVPDIYTLNGTTAYGVQIINTDNITIPLGIASAATGVISLTFTGMDSYNAKITLIDNASEIDLTDLSSYTYDLTLSNAGAPVENRLAINLAPKQSTGIGNVSTDRVVAQRYYNLQGIETAKPQTGEVYLVKTVFRSGKTSLSKVIIR
jgi:hypothetical protein